MTSLEALAAFAIVTCGPALALGWAAHDRWLLAFGAAGVVAWALVATLTI